MLENIFLDTINKYNFFKKKDKLIIGVSGGPDSMCLLHLLNRIKTEKKLELVCAHFNHSLRDEADSEEAFVKNACHNLGIKFISEKKDVNKFFRGDSLEQTARNLRFDFFLKTSRQERTKKLILAHHKDDLVETVLMRLIRGSGLKGLRGFLPLAKFKGLMVIRPLIESRKQDIMQWLKKEKISYCTDKSNFEDKFLRNKIRLSLMPLLSEFNPNIVDSLSNLSRSICLDYDFMQDYASKCFEAVKKGEVRRHVRLDLAGLKKMHPAILGNVIMIAIEQLKGNTRNVELRHIEEIIDLIFNRPIESIVDLPGFFVKKQEKELIIEALIL